MYDGGQLYAQKWDLNKNVKSYEESVPFYIFFASAVTFEVANSWFNY